MTSVDGSTTLRSRPMSARSCVIAAIATGAGALASMGESNSDCGKHVDGGTALGSRKKHGTQAIYQDM